MYAQEKLTKCLILGHFEGNIIKTIKGDPGDKEQQHILDLEAVQNMTSRA